MHPGMSSRSRAPTFAAPALVEFESIEWAPDFRRVVTNARERTT